ncbi:glycosyltransferase family 2 protein [Candidatus Parcubacteria bacterium]|nr:MAG: glycosyltransferase family 2 protein [Candidatus Parcubacteria bacterium]
MISVVIPAKDEERAIVETVREVRSALDGMEYEIIVVDDGSVDATAERAQSAGAKVVRHLYNLGYGAAIKSGIRAAEYDTIGITDGDGTYPNDMIPVLLEKYRQGYDMVVGARTGANYLESPLKAPLRLILKYLVEYTVGRKIPDVNSGLRVFSKKTAVSFFNHLSNSFSFTTSITMAYMLNNRFVAYVPIPYRKRIGKTKVRLFRDSLRTIQIMIESVTYFNPLKIFLLLSALIFIASAIGLVANIVLHVTLIYYVGIGGVLMAMQIFGLGLLAVLLKSILDQGR